ncbi:MULTISPECIES: hypothetical protein [Pseudoalteromonas]|jgi:hypothetical protein|uniref:Uncharacterized protein n=1 Tax=Pseudoalteromonas luteoviolacea (strain 2ta16) TaxID=1353533 RepID=V4HNW8_PSEL2|nr:MULTISPECIES: hypothetical protein [Pseudoalteromonas]ESP92500.1 hypothetical protein PL2TA16_04309 [Pseudoalteromonas luteoviolacea 2ta16]KZN35060.1 hypothetical protein N483_24265 [Pseudoalteromonas luteoviolacea NCIMB 1944]MCG7550649.1 hypothetical protein [Pseudoalteromonas sp. Of7M-16]
MRKILFLFVLIVSSNSYGQTLVTGKYELTITELCEEGVVGCDNVVLNMIEHDSAEKIRIGGEAFHTMCADGVTPCAFQGYRFKTKSETYRILNNGTFQIFDTNGEQIHSEKGKWL